METAGTTKFLFLETIYRQLLAWGMDTGGANFLTFVIACVTLFLLIWVLEIIFSGLFSTTLRMVIRHTNKRKWDNFLQKRKFYKRLVNLILAIIIMAMAQTLFEGFSTLWITWAEKIIEIYLLVVILRLLFSILNTVNDIYETTPQARVRSIRTTIQSVQIIATIITALFIISVLIGKKADDLLIGLGAFAAVIALIFRDTILSFVASIQISAQDLFRPGDWVEMPSRNANGLVEEINVMSLKIRNFDNSVSIIPTYAMISESFTNWRNMQESSGRRFKRPFFVDITSVSTVSDDELQRIMTHPLIEPDLARTMVETLRQTNTAPFVTNIGLFRNYVEALLNRNDKINQEQLRLVRYLDNTEYGITLQLYAFSLEKKLFDYEHIIADIFETMMAVMPAFGLRPYQRPTTGDPV